MGEFVLFLVEKYHNSKITGLSSSITQKTYIDAMSKEQGFLNLEFKIPNYFSYPSFSFDRILSIGVGYTFNHELTNQRGSEDVRTCEELQSTLLQDLYLASPSEREK